MFHRLPVRTNRTPKYSTERATASIIQSYRIPCLEKNTAVGSTVNRPAEAKAARRENMHLAVAYRDTCMRIVAKRL